MKIKKGDKIFKKENKEYLGKVTGIKEVQIGKFLITDLGGEFETDVLTMDDIAMGEWLSVGMELNCSIVMNWYNLKVHDYLSLDSFHKIEKFGVELFYGTKIATFKINEHHIPMVGFGEYYRRQIKDKNAFKIGKLTVLDNDKMHKINSITLEEMAKNEWLSVGMEMDCSIVSDWYEKLFNDTLYIEDGKVEGFKVVDFKGKEMPSFFVNGYVIPMVGFGKYYRGRTSGSKFKATNDKSTGIKYPEETLKLVITELEKGNWYKHKHNEPDVYCLYNGTEDSVGFFSGDIWGDHLRIANTRSWESADIKKVTMLLKNEAERRFPVGTKFKNMESGFIQTIEDADHKVFFYDDETNVNSGRCPREEWHDFTEGKGRSNPEIFRNGKWAEVEVDTKLIDLDERDCANCKYLDHNKLLSDKCYGCKFNNVVNKDNWISREFEIGKWYKAGKVIILYLDEDSEYQCGIRGDKWDDKILVKNIKFWDLADRKDFGMVLLKIAKQKFSVGTKFKNMETGFIQTISDIEHSLNSFGDGIRVNSGGCPTEEWYSNSEGKGNSNAKLFDDGIWAEIVDLNKLELGNVETKIVRDNDGWKVWTNEGSVLTDAWLNWYKIITEGIKNGMTYFKVQLNGYETIYYKGLVDIGCIKQIRMDQIEKVTKAI